MYLCERLEDGNLLRGTKIKPISETPSATTQDTPYTDQTVGIAIRSIETQNVIPPFQPPERRAESVSSRAANYPTPPKSKKDPTFSPLKNPAPAPPTLFRNLSDILEPLHKPSTPVTTHAHPEPLPPTSPA